MVTIESVLSKKNQALALENMRIKLNGGGKDRNPMVEFTEFIEINKDRIREEIISCNYEPGLIQEYEIINGKGKKRTVIKMNDIDRYITRLLAQKMSAFFNQMFLENSFAYQNDKGILKAAEKARDYIENNNEYVVEIDIKCFFDEIPIEGILNKVKEHIKDKAVIDLLQKYLYCTVARDGNTYVKKKGILQGASISPVLSNLYLHNLDVYMESKGYNWVRFADNIYIYVDSMELGFRFFSDICTRLKNEFSLQYNESKSGVFDVYERWMLGYEFRKRGKKIIVEKHIYQPKSYYHEWHPCVVQKVNKEYHITKAGIMNSKVLLILMMMEYAYIRQILLLRLASK